MADFSSRSRFAVPDLVAPGTEMLSLRVPGSTLDLEFPGARVDGRVLPRQRDVAGRRRDVRPRRPGAQRPAGAQPRPAQGGARGRRGRPAGSAFGGRRRPDRSARARWRCRRRTPRRSRQRFAPSVLDLDRCGASCDGGDEDLGPGARSGTAVAGPAAGGPAAAGLEQVDRPRTTEANHPLRADRRDRRRGGRAVAWASSATSFPTRPRSASRGGRSRSRSRATERFVDSRACARERALAVAVGGAAGARPAAGRAAATS